MKKISFFCFAIHLLFCLNVVGQIQIGSGTSTQNNVPIDSYFGYNYSQQIYTASEIGISGQINSISFYFANGNGTNSTSWVVYLGHTSQSAFSSTTNWISSSSLTEVFNGSVVFPAGGNWMTINFTTPFNYDGLSNLVIAIDENTPGFGGSSSSYWRYTSTTSSTTIYYKNDATNPSPANPPAANATSVNRPNIIIGGLTLPSCQSPIDQATNLSFSSITSSSIAASFTAASTAPSGYLVVRSTSATPPAPVDGTTYAIGSTTLGASTNVIASGSLTTFTSSSLSSNTMYYYHIFSYNSTGCSGGPKYNISSPLIGSVTTCLSGTPSTPTLTNETTNSIQASWSAFTGATSYRLDASTNSSFSSYVTGYQDLIVNGTSYVITGLNPNTSYYVRIRAYNESCSSSSSSYASKITLKTEPTNQATAFSAGTVSTTSIPFSWTSAVVGSQAPDGYLIKGSVTSLASISDPIDGIDPGSGSLTFSSGASSYKSSSTSATFTGHSAGTMYYYKIYSYTNSGTGIDFKTDNVPSLYHATQPNSTSTVTFTSTPLNSSQATVSWAVPSGYDASKHKVLVFVKSGSTVINTTSLTTNSTSFVANTAMGSGTPHPNDATAYCVYNGDGTSVTISGLTGNTTYQVRVLVGMMDVNSNGTYTYSSGTTASGTTLKTEPTNQATAFSAGTVSTSSIPFSWTSAVAGSQAPDGYLIKGSSVSLATITDPIDGTDPTDVTSFTTNVVNKKQTPGSSTGTTSFTGMTAGTMYYYKIYSYANSGSSIDFKTDNVSTLNHATLPEANSSLVFNTTLSNSTAISWSKPASYSNDNHTTLVFVKLGTAVTAAIPTFAPSYYTANSIFSTGTAYQGDAAAYCVYKGDATNVIITGLNGNTTYYFYIVTVVDSTNSNGTNSYSSGISASKTTLCSQVDSFNLTFEESSSLPSCTSFLSTDGLGANVNTTYPYQGLRCLGLQNGTTYILPNINNAHLNSHQISFYSRTFSGTGQIGFGYLTDPSNAATYVNLQTFNLTTNYQLCSYIPINIPPNVSIAVKLLTNSVLRVDNIIWEPKPIIIWSNQTWSNTTGPTQYDNAEIRDNLILNQNLATNNLNINSNYVVTVNPNIVLTVKGNLINNGGIVFKSDVSGTGIFDVFAGSITGVGSVTTERYIPAKRAWRLLTAPLKGSSSTTIPDNWLGVANEGLLLFSPSTYQSQTMSGYTIGGGSPNIWKYNSANTQWQSIPDLTNENLFTSTVNNGFLVFATGPYTSTNVATGEAVTTLRPKGQLITGDVSYSLSANQYHLFGNPYASPLNTEAMVQANSGTKVFMVDPSLGTVGGYVIYDGANWAPTTPIGSEKYIQSGQGFFVRSASNSTFNIIESHKVTGNSNTWFERTSSNASSNSSASVEADKIRVLLYKQIDTQWQLADGILAVNSVGGNDGVDAVDTGKMSNFNENILFRNGTNNLAIEYRGLPTTGTVQPMRLTGTTVQPYQLRVKTENYSNSDLQPYLEDTQTGTLTLIPTDGSEVIVSFTGVVATVAAPDTRFRIVYPSALGVDAPDALAVGVYPNPTEEGMFTIVLPSAGETARYTLTNLVGQEVLQGTLDSVSSRVSVSSLQGGVYLLEVNQSGKRFTTKLIIK